MLPAICCSETFAMLVSSTSMNVAIETMTATSQGLWSPAADLSRAMASPDLCRDLDRHPRRQTPVRVVRDPVEDDLHRDALDHLDPVPGGVLWRDDAEGLAARGLNTV